MSNSEKLLVALIIVVFFVSAIAVKTVYYNGKISDLNSHISRLEAQINNLTSEVTNLTIALANPANLTADLKAIEVPSSDNPSLPTPVIYDNLFISGFVNNTGQSTAYNAGLCVVAYDANGLLLINMTIPLANFGAFGTDAQVDSWLSAHANYVDSNQLSTLYGEQSQQMSIGIYHQGIAIRWTITPVWTNIP